MHAFHVRVTTAEGQRLALPFIVPSQHIVFARLNELFPNWRDAQCRCVRRAPQPKGPPCTC